MLANRVVPANRSAALRIKRPKKMVNDEAWATNFMKGLRITLPTWTEGRSRETTQRQRTLFL